MNYNRYLDNYSYRSVKPHFVKVVSVIRDSPTSKVSKVTRKLVQTNSPSYLSSLPSVNPDQLELDLATGVSLKRVDSRVLSPDSLDSNLIDFGTPSDGAKNDDNKDDSKTE